MKPMVRVMFPLRSRKAILFQYWMVLPQKNGEERVQLSVYTRHLIGKGNPSIVSIVTCWQKVVTQKVLYNFSLNRSHALCAELFCISLRKPAASVSPTKRPGRPAGRPGHRRCGHRAWAR